MLNLHISAQARPGQSWSLGMGRLTSEGFWDSDYGVGSG